MSGIIIKKSVMIKKWFNLLIFIFYGVLFCLFFLRFGISFETDDDWFLMTRIQGVFKQSTPFLIFSNIFYGYALLFLYKIIPQINWYIAIQLFFLYLAICQLSIVLLNNKRKNDIIIILAFLFIINLIKEIFFAFQFTKTASITIIAGYAWLYNGVSHAKSIKYTLWGIVTLCFGALVRFDCLFLVIPAMGIIIIYDFFIIHKCGKKRKRLLYRKVSLLFFTTLLCSFLPFCEKMYIRHHDKYAEFMSYNRERTKFNDYPHLSYNENKDFFESHGISENDFLMLERRNDIDGFYTKELISIINSVSYPKKKIKIIFQSLLVFFPNSESIPFLSLCCIIIIISIFFKRDFFILVMLLYLFSFSFFFVILGRFPWRINISILTTCLVFVFLKSKLVLVLKSRNMKLFFILFVLYTIFTFPQNVKERCDDIIAILNNDKENIYMIDLWSVYHIYRDNKYTTLLTPSEKYHNIFHLGSWETKTPENLKHNAENNMATPFSASINSPKHIIISSPYNIYLFEKFINEHYDDKAKAVPVLENKSQGIYLYRIITGVKNDI